MKHYTLILLWLLLPALPYKVYAQSNISGVVNIYTPVTGFSDCNGIDVLSSTGFSVGDVALIIQMQGAQIDESNTSAFGTITDYHNAGNYEIIHIVDIIGNTVYYEFQLLNQYDLGGKVQLITIPQYTDVTITDTLTAAPWNGTIGGVLIFEASGSVQLNEVIDVSGKGFRGGDTNDYYQACHVTDYFLDAATEQAGGKGEGIAEIIAGKELGRGAQANGGGGGNSHNAGGGGGGNAAQGGYGGYEYNGPTCNNNMNTNTRGEGGKGLIYGNPMQKIFLGGGGGASHQNNYEASNGANGGGIIIIKASSINNNNQKIIANGITAENGMWDGGGGGGAGGAVLLDVQNFGAPIDIEAKGGNGGNVDFEHYSCWGPGGGGGGGAIWLSGQIPGSVQTDVSGGVNGVRLNTQASCYNSPHGSTPGQDGVSLSDLIIPESDIPILPLVCHAGNDTAVCVGEMAILGDNPVISNGTAPYSYFWSPAQGLDNPNIAHPTATINSPAEYSLIVIDAKGCMGYDTVNLTLDTVSLGIIASEDSICSGNVVTLTANGSAATYIWSTGDTLSSTQVSEPGIYWLSTTLSNGCTSLDSIEIYSLTSPQVWAGNDTSTCDNASIQLNPVIAEGSSPYAYNWLPNVGLNDASIANPIATPDTSTNYILVVTDNNGCTSSDDIFISVSSGTNISIISTTDTICPNGSATLSASGNATTYLWSTNDTIPSIDIYQSGTYWLTTQIGTCTSTDSIEITQAISPIVSLGNDTFVCINQSIQLNAVVNNGSPPYSYYWSPNGNLDNYSISSPIASPTFTETCVVVVTDQLGCTATEDITITVIEAAADIVTSDDTLCPQEIATLSIIGNVTDYNWSTNEQSSSIEVGNPGLYYFSGSYNGCLVTDTIFIDSAELPQFNLGNDTTICPGTLNQVALSSSADGDYLWSNGSTSHSITVSTSGGYWLEIQNYCGASRDSISIIFQVDSFAIVPSGDTICVGDNTTLGIDGNSTNILWSNGETATQILVETSGLYWVSASIGNCSYSDTVAVKQTALPEFSLGNDTTFCMHTEYELTIPNSFYGNYYWSTGDTSSSISINSGGWYWLEVENECGVAVDSVSVIYASDSARTEYFPNTITPNGNRKNDIFYIVNALSNNFSMYVFNRWGEEIYESHDPYEGWNGTYMSEIVPEGVYYFIANFENCNGEIQRIQGHINVLR